MNNSDFHSVRKQDAAFGPHHKMRALVSRNAFLLPVLSRFGISLGFGESTVEEVCCRDKVDTETFLAVCNFSTSGICDFRAINIPALIGYLKNAHRFFLEYRLPDIRNKLIGAVSLGKNDDYTWMLIKFYDEYVEEVRRHMDYEDKYVFEYVADLLRGVRRIDFSIERFRKNHLPIADKLREIKDLLIGHYTAERGRADVLNTVLFELMTCERDLLLHCSLEDNLFIPAVMKAEGHEPDLDVTETAVGFDENVPVRSVKGDAGIGCTEEVRQTAVDENGDVVLTLRERDIVRAIARGLSNKEIAEQLFLSVHTVTTHRRNITNKLNIHSPSGLTIYALMHGLISLRECSASLA